MSIYFERARRGVALLDERVPNWRESVDLSSLVSLQFLSLCSGADLRAF